MNVGADAPGVVVGLGRVLICGDDGAENVYGAGFGAVSIELDVAAAMFVSIYR